MSKFSKGDRVRQIPNLLPPILGAPRDVVCVVVRSAVYFGDGPDGRIDVQMPDGDVITSLSAARFELAEIADEGRRPEDLDVSNVDKASPALA